MAKTKTRYKDIAGRRFGRLTAIEYVGRDNQRRALWRCRCVCGNHLVARGTQLRYGSPKSCGCLQRERAVAAATTHGLSGGQKQTRRLYRIWRNMKQRCSNPRAAKYTNYGGRGITVYDEWQDYVPFHDWAVANGYAAGLTIERIDNDGDYEPNNCRWATYEEQSLNSRQNNVITYKGQSHPLKVWADMLGMKYSTLRSRIMEYGWSVEDAMETPIRRRTGSAPDKAKS